MIIGGGEIYAQAMPLADRLYISHVALSPEGDVMFPAIDPDALDGRRGARSYPDPSGMRPFTASRSMPGDPRACR